MRPFVKLLYQVVVIILDSTGVRCQSTKQRLPRRVQFTGVLLRLHFRNAFAGFQSTRNRYIRQVGQLFIRSARQRAIACNQCNAVQRIFSITSRSPLTLSFFV